MEKIKLTVKYIIAEERNERKRKVIVNKDGSYSWTRSTMEATLFDTVDHAEKAIKKILDEDFGIEIYKVRLINGAGKVNIAMDNNMYTYRKIYRIDIKDITKFDVDLTINTKEVNKVLKMSNREIAKNRDAVKKFIFTKIGVLIDFHDRCSISFTPGSNLAEDRRNIGCQGCPICAKVEELTVFLDSPYLSKYYDYALGNKTYLFDSVKGIRKDGFDDAFYREILRGFKDYVGLRLSGYKNADIQEMYGLSQTRLYRYYDVLAESDYYRILGRSEKADSKAKGYKRNEIDPSTLF